MPELPEVETIARQLEPLIKGQRVLRVGGAGSQSWRAWKHGSLSDRRIGSVRRRGKLLVLELEGGARHPLAGGGICG
jgi:formamidopyrimidine-DNA glycosylase